VAALTNLGYLTPLSMFGPPRYLMNS